MNNSMNKVVHFELPYTNVKRASDFYRNMFSWEVTPAQLEDSNMEYHMAITGPIDEINMPKESGFINGGLLPKNDIVKSAVIAVRVEDIYASLKMVEGQGGVKISDPMEVGEMGYYAYIKDTEDNVIGLWQDKDMT